MSKESTEDRIYRYLVERGESASSPELAKVFLSSANVPEGVAEKIIAPLLSRDGRFARDAEGRWRAEEVAGAEAPAAYVVAEFLLAPGVTGQTPIECAVIKLQEDRVGEVRPTLVRPTCSLATGVRLPEGLSHADLDNAPTLERVLDRLAKFARGCTLASFRRSPFHARVCRADTASPIAYLSVRQLARRLGVIPRQASLHECAEALQVVLPREPRAAELATASVEVLRLLLGRLRERGIADSASLEDFLAPRHIEVDFSKCDFDQTFLETLPAGPGVYTMRDANGKVVYVGKAKDLRRRVASYFKRRVGVDERDQRIRERTASIEVEPVGSELEALLLERRAIADQQPELNQQTEIHPRPAHDRRDPDVILILPSREPGCAEPFLVADGRRLRQVRVPQSDPHAARSEIASAYFAGTPTDAETEPEVLEVLWSWLETNRDQVSMIHVEATGGMDEVMRLLGDHLTDPETDGARTYRV